MCVSKVCRINCLCCYIRNQINQQGGIGSLTGNNNSQESRGNQPPPPLPVRPDVQLNNIRSNQHYSPDMSLGGYGGGFGGHNMMSSFGGGGYGGGFGGYGGGYGYGSRYGMYGQNTPSDENDFIRVAEESSRQAFQSIESIVHAFGSVSMMLESTYFAVHSSFRAVLGVADHISRMKGHMTQVVSSMTIIKTLAWFVRRLGFLLGLTDIDPNNEAAWKEASANFTLTPESMVQTLTTPNRKSSWPIMMFFAVVFGTPWLIWKLLLSLSGGSSSSVSKWMQGEGDHYVAKGLYDFVTNNPREVSFTAGQQILIAPKQQQPNVNGWLLASVDGIKTGFVPTNYIEIIAFCPAIDQDAAFADSVSSQSSKTHHVDPIQSQPAASSSLSHLGSLSSSDTPVMQESQSRDLTKTSDSC